MSDRLDPDWSYEGEHHIDVLRGLIHRTVDRRALDKSALESWMARGRQMEAVEIEAGAPPIKLWLDPERRNVMLLGQWARESGLSDEEAVRELSRRMDAGEPLPWEGRRPPEGV